MAQEQKVAVENVVEDVVEEQPTAAVPAGSDDANSTSIAAAAAAAQGISPSVFQKQQSAAEKKARKAMQKKGLEQVTGIANISVIRKKGPMFSIYTPDVYKNASSDTWIIFGEARVDNFGKMLNSAGQRAPVAPPAAATVPTVEAASTSAVSEPAASKEEAVDETGIDSKNIEVVMSQANCSRADAVKALKANNNDMVNAIMELTA
ncbi:hypothetical protein GGI25_000654 [Coemansia spiralis]|uniref:Nascent polypeptide-associated complex subunit alpha n=2 Tax=Coemansia TaxID=4863 RepID=A0A9W8GC58_9FUNG|nr:hypothetical protein EDC05_000608 [Coemansia umbellata]KAJ2623720.1 hypothetical protein GGI26_002167 [Coemansia sp. RSA 1358]KAJ2680362.1 hypothetical protein GGI25_000654 [Coemansia spiralis]